MSKVFTITAGLENMGALKSGGQASVYKARRADGTITAVKLIPTPIYTESPEDKNYRDFQNEVEKLKRVNENPSPNVVKILNYGITETGSLPFIEMEFIEGPDMEELLKAPHDKIFSVAEAIKVAEQLSNALAHCHRVTVKHGDIKSNNVKFDIHTGNYVLLDFGLALMSDEQRRTSLRHAGAIEFMAPEQNDGKMLFQSDVYSFGIIIYELLAGRVPFPLHHNSETARNQVRLSHIESSPPDLLELREQNLPSSWSDEKKRAEMLVPQWLLNMIERCLEKQPAKRFANGMELNDFISSSKKTDVGASHLQQIDLLRRENKKLQQEREELRRLVEQSQAAKNQQSQYIRTKTSSNKPAIIILSLLCVGLAALLGWQWYRNSKGQQQTVINDTSLVVPGEPGKLGQYKVAVARAYFHNQPDESTQRSAYLTPTSDVITAMDEKNGFIYTEFTNRQGLTSKGWIKKSELMPLQEWNRKVNQPDSNSNTPTDNDNAAQQLEDARDLLQKGETREALYIYNDLSQKEIPEAMYQYGNLTLQNQNPDIDCTQALKLVEKAGTRGYTPAKRTLGFLYVFADSPQILEMNNYNHCPVQRNFTKGLQLLTEAVLRGDSTAKRILDEINNKRTVEEPQ